MLAAGLSMGPTHQGLALAAARSHHCGATLARFTLEQVRTVAYINLRLTEPMLSMVVDGSGQCLR